MFDRYSILNRCIFVPGRTERKKNESLELLPFVLGVFASIILMVILSIVVAFIICSKRKQEVPQTTSKSAIQENFSPNVSHREVMNDNFSGQSPVSEEKNPDLIPLSNGKQFNLKKKLLYINYISIYKI